MAIKDDEKLLDEAVANLYADIVSFDRARAERVISLIIRHHRESRDAFKALLNDLSKRRQPVKAATPTIMCQPTG
jgi:hypothetical protein